MLVATFASNLSKMLAGPPEQQEAEPREPPAAGVAGQGGARSEARRTSPPEGTDTESSLSALSLAGAVAGGRLREPRVGWSAIALGALLLGYLLGRHAAS